MPIRPAGWFTAALLAAATIPICAATAHADTHASPAHVAPPPGGYGGYGGYGNPAYGHHYRHHYHPNCNNDPDSEFAMDPDVCPASHNDPGYGGPD